MSNSEANHSEENKASGSFIRGLPAAAGTSRSGHRRSEAWPRCLELPGTPELSPGTVGEAQGLLEVGRKSAAFSSVTYMNQYGTSIAQTPRMMMQAEGLMDVADVRRHGDHLSNPCRTGAVRAGHEDRPASFGQRSLHPSAYSGPTRYSSHAVAPSGAESPSREEG